MFQVVAAMDGRTQAFSTLQARYGNRLHPNFDGSPESLRTRDILEFNLGPDCGQTGPQARRSKSSRTARISGRLDTV